MQPGKLLIPFINLEKAELSDVLPDEINVFWCKHLNEDELEFSVTHA